MENQDNKGKLVLKSVLEPKDEIDRFLLEEVLLIVQHTDTFELIKFWGHTKFQKDKIDDQYFPSIIAVIKSLFKANHSRRKYHEQCQKLEKELLEESLKARSTIDLIYEKHDVISEVDNSLYHIKAALDSLATSLNPIYNLKLDGWHKKKDKNSGKTISGQNIINSLSNLPTGGYGDSEKLKQFIIENQHYVHYIVSLRDAPTHKGGLSNVQGFRYVVREKKIVEPIILHPDGYAQYVSKFLDDTVWNFVKFVQIFIVLSLSNLIKDMFLAQDSDGRFKWFAANLPQQKK